MEYVQMVPKWLEALNYIFLDQKFPSVIKFGAKFENNAF